MGKTSCHQPACHSANGKPDILLWASLVVVIIGWLYTTINSPLATEQTHNLVTHMDTVGNWINRVAISIYQLVNTMFWGITLGLIMLALLTKIPREFVIALLGNPKTTNGILRATLAGVFLDLCNHGILMVVAKLYERGASIGQVMAFLIASPWNSFSLTFVLISLIGFGWTLLFIALSAIIAIFSGLMFDALVKHKVLPENPVQPTLPENFKFVAAAQHGLTNTRYNSHFFSSLIIDGIKASQMVMRWILFGIVLAAVIRSSISADVFSQYFGPTIAGLGVTLVAAILIEVCSEGSTPLAADLIQRANAPGNSFAFLMAGVSTDYTEIMVIKETTKSWKTALYLPLLTLPQIIVLAWLINLGNV